MEEQITLGKPAPLLTSWTEDGGSFATGSYYTREKYRELQNRRFATAMSIDRDFASILEYVSPSNNNIECHSPRITALLIRVVIEVESCLRAILIENCELGPKKQPNMRTLSKVELSHSLSRYSARIFGWEERQRLFVPFLNWHCYKFEWSKNNEKVNPLWYDAYNTAKHDVLSAGKVATFFNLCNAMSGLHILLVSQFGRSNWGPQRDGISWNGQPEYSCHIGNIVEVKCPSKDRCRVVYGKQATKSKDTECFKYS